MNNIHLLKKNSGTSNLEKTKIKKHSAPMNNDSIKDSLRIKDTIPSDDSIKFYMFLKEHIDVPGFINKYSKDMPEILRKYAREHPGKFSKNRFLAFLLNYLEDNQLADNDFILVDKEEYRDLQKTSMFDELTRIHNRRYILEALTNEYVRSKRSNIPFSVAILDIDNFKYYNDSFGHLVGDKVLVEVGKLIKDSVRQMDLAGRYGGDEFIILFPETVESSAVVIAERVRRKIQESALKYAPIRVSIGVACSSGKGSLDEVITLADKALYRAKAIGRNKVCASKDDMRVNPRFNITMPVTLYPLHVSKGIPANLMDISLGGARVRTDESFPPWGHIKMDIHGKDMDKNRFPVAQVMRVESVHENKFKNEIGLKFDHDNSVSDVENILNTIVFSDAINSDIRKSG